MVFVRLYWFEKRFQKIVLDAQKLRRTRTRERGGTFSKTDTQANPDFNLEEQGVGSRKIMVMRPEQHMIDRISNAIDNDDGFKHTDFSEKQKRDHILGDSSGSGSTSNGDNSSDAGKGIENDTTFVPQPFRREITFADEIEPERDIFGDRLPSQRTTDQHIAFLENQRHPKDNSVLYIPGPRDFDRGDIPQQINEGEELEMLKQHKRTWSLEHDNLSPTDNSLGKTTSGIHFAPSAHGMFTRLKPHGREDTQEKPESTNGDIAGLRRRRASFSRYLTASENGDDAMPPYLSWQPTLGRNSTFVDLSEEQREELGGIEYRALKTLAFVLCSKTCEELRGIRTNDLAAYFIGFHLFGLVCFLPWILHSSDYYKGVLSSDGLSQVWWYVVFFHFNMIQNGIN